MKLHAMDSELCEADYILSLGLFPSTHFCGLAGIFLGKKQDEQRRGSEIAGRTS